MNGDLLEDGVVFLQLQTLSGVLTVLGGDVARCAGHTGGFVLGAFEDHLHAIAFCFLCHFDELLERLNVEVGDFGEVALGGCFLDGSVEAFLVDGAQTGG